MFSGKFFDKAADNLSRRAVAAIPRDRKRARTLVILQHTLDIDILYIDGRDLATAGFKIAGGGKFADFLHHRAVKRAGAIGHLDAVIAERAV